MKKGELRRSVSISLLPSEKAILKAASEQANETTLSAFVKKVLLKAVAEMEQNGPKK